MILILRSNIYTSANVTLITQHSTAASRDQNQPRVTSHLLRQRRRHLQWRSERQFPHLSPSLFQLDFAAAFSGHYFQRAALFQSGVNGCCRDLSLAIVCVDVANRATDRRELTRQIRALWSVSLGPRPNLFPAARADMIGYSRRAGGRLQRPPCPFRWRGRVIAAESNLSTRRRPTESLYHRIMRAPCDLFG